MDFLKNCHETIIILDNILTLIGFLVSSINYFKPTGKGKCYEKKLKDFLKKIRAIRKNAKRILIPEYSWGQQYSWAVGRVSELQGVELFGLLATDFEDSRTFLTNSTVVEEEMVKNQMQSFSQIELPNKETIVKNEKKTPTQVYCNRIVENSHAEESDHEESDIGKEDRGKFWKQYCHTSIITETEPPPDTISDKDLLKKKDSRFSNIIGLVLYVFVGIMSYLINSNEKGSS